tara:strand:+ start:485 stop:1582 length:1098 start_codon:yes stop_codon:yes gene_type:complete
MDFSATEHPTIETELFQIANACFASQVDKIPGHGSPLCLLGPPGVSKTALVRQLAEFHNMALKVFILGSTPAPDLVGFYVPDLKEGKVRHLITQDIINPEYDRDKYDGVIVLLDEFANCVEQMTTIQSTIEDWSMEGQPVNKDVFFVLASNRPEDMSGANEIPKSVVDRVYIHEVKPAYEQWLKWAMKNGIDYTITGYIAWKKDEALFDFDPNAPVGGQPSPRSWEKLSNLIKHLPIKSPDMIAKAAIAKVGEVKGIEYSGYARLASELCTTEEVLADPENAAIPHHNTSACYAMCLNLATELAGRIEKKEDVLKEEVEAIITYFRRMDDAMAVFGFSMCVEANPAFAERSAEFTKFKQDYKGLS